MRLNRNPRRRQSASTPACDDKEGTQAQSTSIQDGGYVLVVMMKKLSTKSEWSRRTEWLTTCKLSKCLRSRDAKGAIYFRFS